MNYLLLAVLDKVEGNYSVVGKPTGLLRDSIIQYTEKPIAWIIKPTPTPVHNPTPDKNWQKTPTKESYFPSVFFCHFFVHTPPPLQWRHIWMCGHWKSCITHYQRFHLHWMDAFDNFFVGTVSHWTSREQGPLFDRGTNAADDGCGGKTWIKWFKEVPPIHFVFDSHSHSCFYDVFQ